MGGLTFKPKLAKAVMAGTKTQTRRRLSDNPDSPWWREECGFKRGEHYAVQPGRGKKQIGRALIVDVRRERLGALTDSAALAEGVASREAFRSLWVDLHGSFDPDEVVWVLALERRLRYVVVEPSRHGTSCVRRHPARTLREVEQLRGEIGDRCWAIDNRTGTRV